MQHLQVGRSALVAPAKQSGPAFSSGVCLIQCHRASDMWMPNGEREKTGPAGLLECSPASQGGYVTGSEAWIPQHCNMSLTAASLVSKYRVAMCVVREPSQGLGSVLVAAYTV